jgi:hypothetical protein
MKCPHCEQALTERSCPHCHAAIVDVGPYCSYCGRRLNAEAAGAAEPAATGEATAAAVNEEMADPDWENRVLCSDGNCIGVIGPDGHCKVCGKPLQEESAAASAEN